MRSTFDRYPHRRRARGVRWHLLLTLVVLVYVAGVFVVAAYPALLWPFVVGVGTAVRWGR